MKRALIVFFILVIATPLSVFLIYQYAPLASLPTPPWVDTESKTREAIEEAIRQAIIESKEEAITLLLYETEISDIRISQDGLWATAWLIAIDAESGQPAPIEPGLAIVQKIKDEWKATLPSNYGWLELLLQLPEDLMPPQLREELSQQAAFYIEAVAVGPFGGYYLPWEGGRTLYLTQSVGHDRYTPSGSAHYAFDFATPGYPSGLFNVLAAKSGRVKQAVWRHPNGDPNYANYIVLEDTSTSPVTYQLYMHLAQDSIPQELRTIGAPVRQGQFIGVADDTGVSSGNHLHFMVHTNSASYWGTSVDITFVDVDINGGRPRINSDLPYCKSTDVCEETRTAYVSGNFMNPDHIPPTGNIITPLQSMTASNNPLRLEGWASDEGSGLNTVQFLAKYNGTWKRIGPTFTSSPFSTNWDMCAANVPDGPLSLALEIRDLANNFAPNLPGLRHISKNYTCPPPPSCSPGANQIALFADPDYQGTCILLGTGNYASHTSLGSLGGDNAASILVGANVQATLFTSPSYLGRAETFFASDSSLSNNRIGSNTVSSVKVQSRSTLPATPLLVFPAEGAQFNDQASFPLSWENAGGATEFQARIKLSLSNVLTSTWQQATHWHLASLPAGNYLWQVRGRNPSGMSNWSTERLFTVIEGSSSQTEATAPYTDTFETLGTNWSHSNFWDLTNKHNHTPGGTVSFEYDTGSASGYDTGAPNAGFLTSPPVFLPEGQVHYLRFWYLYETEGQGTHWDQRWVQISVDDAPFTNLFQLSNDPPHFWLKSPVISLAEYAGHRVRIRFYFATLDALLNGFAGWKIDDFSISPEPPPDCGDANNTSEEAQSIDYGTAIQGVICPGGDMDYYVFQGSAGDQIGAWVQAAQIGSALDPYISLLDADGISVLAENDDQVLAQRTDAWLTYRLSRSGTYYLRLRAWNHPSAGGNQYFYTLRLFQDNNDPVALILYPKDGGSVALGTIDLLVSAADSESGVSHVRFLQHSADWQNDDWVVLGEDWDGADGWNWRLDLSNFPNAAGMAFYAMVFDWAGNWFGTGAWNLNPGMLFMPIIIKP